MSKHCIIIDLPISEVEMGLGVRSLNSTSKPFIIESMEFVLSATGDNEFTSICVEDGDLPTDLGAQHIVDVLGAEQISEIYDLGSPREKDKFQKDITHRIISNAAPVPQAPQQAINPMMKRLLDIQKKMPNDRFVDSLITQFKRRGALSPKQVSAIEKIEKRLANPTPVDQGVVDRINAILKGIPKGNSFLESVRDQALNGRNLSQKQLDAIAKFEDKAKVNSTSMPKPLKDFYKADLDTQKMYLADGKAIRATGGTRDDDLTRIASYFSSDDPLYPSAKKKLKDFLLKTYKMHPVLAHAQTRAEVVDILEAVIMENRKARMP